MDAIELLTQQHRQVKDLFHDLEGTGERAKKSRERLCEQLSDALAVHAEIEEKIFYPACKDARTEDQLREAVEEHLSAKRIIADLVQENFEEEQLDAKLAVLKEQVLHHVEEEESELFPKVKKLLGQDRLDELGEQMNEMAEELRSQGESRMQVPGQTDRPAHL